MLVIKKNQSLQNFGGFQVRKTPVYCRDFGTESGLVLNLIPHEGVRLLASWEG